MRAERPARSISACGCADDGADCSGQDSSPRLPSSETTNSSRCAPETSVGSDGHQVASNESMMTSAAPRFRRSPTSSCTASGPLDVRELLEPMENTRDVAAGSAGRHAELQAPPHRPHLDSGGRNTAARRTARLPVTLWGNERSPRRTLEPIWPFRRAVRCDVPHHRHREWRRLEFHGRFRNKIRAATAARDRQLSSPGRKNRRLLLAPLKTARVGAPSRRSRCK